jgi:osmotically inducible protein OsmC
MLKRSANAIWNGDLKKGNGKVSVESGLIKEADYSFTKRFENEPGTNPEELLGAAHAACFSMALSAALSGEGFEVRSIKTTDKVYLDKVADGFAITKIEVFVEGEVAGIDEEKFLQFAEKTKAGCPVSKALAGVEFVLNAKFTSTVSA